MNNLGYMINITLNNAKKSKVAMALFISLLLVVFLIIISGRIVHGSMLSL